MKIVEDVNIGTPGGDEVDAAFERRLSAVSRAVEDHHVCLVDYLHRLAGQRQDAENLAQDLWVYVLLHFDEDKIQSLPLLRRKAFQLFVDYYRRLVRRGEVISDEVPDLPSPVVADTFDSESEAALKERFWAEYPGIDLTDRQKEVLWLHARYGFTCKEIEGLISVPASTVGDWLTLGRRKLAERINEDMRVNR
ncbi:RNA polymerase sigma factor [Luteolibacter sp. Populi]|uniref:RNA polymerase sigma factor n=1 Tax=Luteolibacter sp. Populi TaxID=3230487 RepID=UPI003467A1B2